MALQERLAVLEKEKEEREEEEKKQKEEEVRHVPPDDRVFTPGRHDRPSALPSLGSNGCEGKRQWMHCSASLTRSVCGL